MKTLSFVLLATCMLVIKTEFVVQAMERSQERGSSESMMKHGVDLKEEQNENPKRHGKDSFKLLRHKRDIESDYVGISEIPVGTSPLLSRCSQPPDSGMCLAYFQNYYYNSARGICETFVYGGCGGNDNNFWNQRDCETVCGVGAINDEDEESEFSLIMESLQPLVERKDDCEYPPETGECRAAFQHYYFNGEKCETFIYGGCGGNPNNFPTEEECTARCMTNSGNESEENEV